MNEYENRLVGNEVVGGHKQRKALGGSVVRLRTEFPRSLFTSLTEVPLVRVPQGKKLRKTGRVDTEVRPNRFFCLGDFPTEL